MLLYMYLFSPSGTRHCLWDCRGSVPKIRVDSLALQGEEDVNTEHVP